ncbi:gamma-aminobutyric acid receptor alpha-like [Haliotis rufescens]|uniref:gamma-aminobutyric acid receptor alpha-like n=1 Tax=Haliotis rufescens TaxID=6454 RepID=UPI001EB034C3|nr:gamma-aminobutyric acid receptor alpha-like [Haliotis rufescens]XP_046372048.1 gamma-aminobutyric acid receptor alpha-like [Haliotis rufescens]XP_048243855.1 gamma-aminobutyric acid receptor alpha-like [Haliotis rufescens]XP_048243856.1 gamma-aminobutyric acid receptor alpha-like [Haliotis rufescens]
MESLLTISILILKVAASSAWNYGGGMNMTTLLDSLLDDYDRRLRPGFGGPPLVVKTDILVRSMGPMSEKDMIYSMDCYFRQFWQDARLAFNATMQGISELSLSSRMLERIWYPDTFFLNGGRSYLHSITSPNKFFRLQSDGNIYFSQRLTIKAHCRMDLESFPMDTQKCPLRVGSFGYSHDDVIYIWRYGNKEAISIYPDVTMSQFDIIGLPANNASKYLKGAVHSILTVFFHMRRHTGYFLIQVYVPCCLLVVLSWVSFWINREATSDRIALGTTTILTMTFLALENRDDLPHVAYYTALDIYVVMCFLFVMASIVQFAAVHYFTKYSTDDREMMSDDSEGELEESYLTTSTTAGGGIFTEGGCNRCLQCLTKWGKCILDKRNRKFNKHVRNALGLNSVSKIDKVSRFLFPAAFIAINIFYWVTYLPS